MSLINPLARELSAKIVYYGPGLSGKTTSLQFIYGAVRPERRGELVSLATETDRTIFFDFLPLHVERVNSLGVRFQLYTVPGQVFYGATRKLVLTGADGVVFVADSQPSCRDSNAESFESLKQNIVELGLELEDLPLVFQYNKRDLPDAVPVREMSAQLNFLGAPEFATCATSGDGVLAVLKEISKLVIKALAEQQPAVRRQIVDDEERVRRAPDAGIAGSVYAAASGFGSVVSVASAASVASVPNPANVQGAPSVPARASAASAAAERSDELSASFETAVVRRASIEAPEPPAGPRRSKRLSFAGLWPDERASAVREIEGLICASDHAAAVRAAARALAELLDGLPGLQQGAEPGVKAALLGLDGREYLRVCRLATLPKEALGPDDALLALHVLVAARFKLRYL